MCPLADALRWSIPALELGHGSLVLWTSSAVDKASSLAARQSDLPDG